MNSKDVIEIAAWILCVALIPGSFIGAFFVIRKPVKNTGARVLLTIILGGVFLVAGLVAIVAGCSSVAPMDFK